MSKPRLVIPPRRGVEVLKYFDNDLNTLVHRIRIRDIVKYPNDYDWDYIYELLCDPKLNLLDQIKYSDQINMLRQELDYKPTVNYHRVDSLEEYSTMRNTISTILKGSKNDI